jgi:hypothetical protein
MPRFELWAQEARMSAAHKAAERVKAAAAASPPALDPEFERRINATAARYEAEARARQNAEVRRGPRIRSL